MMNAETFNEIVWSSQEMVTARAALIAAQAELSDESKGWGKMPLETAMKHLQVAMQNIGDMMRMDQEPIEV